MSKENFYKTGEHILAVPISDPYYDKEQIKFYDGYDAVDICACNGGILNQKFCGGFILYVNNTDVECLGETNYFGIPIEKAKEKKLSRF